ncbi:MAG: radical SAM protein, partial [Planctomycetota bacterium]
LGFQVAHGARVAHHIRERFPDLPIIWGGWFPSVSPELYLNDGIADAVALAQGEITFWEVVQALDAGENLESVPGLVLKREGEIVRTDPRVIVGWDEIPDVPWHLIDFEEYVALQNDPGPWKLRHKYPDPWDLPAGTPVRGFSYYSSYGCPEPCTFCCSPLVTNRRWKAIPGKLLADRLLECHERFNFNVMRFQDANFGVAEKRSNEFCNLLVEAGSPFWWSGCYEIETIDRYAESSLDLMQAAHCHMISVGAEAGSKEQQDRILKKIEVDHFETSLAAMNNRGITTGTSWIIGYPEESNESMMATIRYAARMKYLFPRSASDIFPFRPIPGTVDFNRCVELGYKQPQTLEEWGSCLEYRLDIGNLQLPDDVLRTWKRYGVASTFYDGLAMEGSRAIQRLMRSISGWRLKHDNYGFPLEHKFFHLYVKMTRQRKEDLLARDPQHDRTYGVTPSAPV